MKQLPVPFCKHRPAYCPNPNCQHHSGAHEVFYWRNGFCKTEKPPFINRRYKCRNCGKQFSDNTFKMDYRKRKTNIGALILALRTAGLPYRQMGRLLGMSEHAMRLRCGDLARQAMIKESLFGQRLVLSEPIAYDGFESFSYSQFSPCYINTAVGARSHYTYATTFSPLNRKGRMTKWQKLKNAQLQRCFGPYPRNSVRVQTTYILGKLLNYCSGELKLFTDEHKAYSASVNIDLASSNICHETISSRAKRDALNPLFAANHLHLTMRHLNSAHRRECIGFHKNEAGLMDAVVLARVHKNFMLAKFAKPTTGDPSADCESPAMKIGLTGKILEFEDFFDLRRPVGHAKFDEQELKMYRRQWEYSRVKIVPYRGA